MNCNNFHSNSWIATINKYQKDLLPIQTIENNKVWCEYLPNAADLRSSRIRCRLCYKYYDEFKLLKNHKSALATKEGILKKNKRRKS